MKTGYAALNITLGTKMRTCRIKTVELEGMKKVKELTLHNLNEVIKILHWNTVHQINFFRVSSDIVPFGSHEILTWDWWMDEDVLKLTNEIKQIKEKNNFRLTVHPGQYTIINSPKEMVVKNAFSDLEYHNKLLNLVGGTDMVIHVGGVYGDKDEAKKRFIKNYQQLDRDIKSKLILENDDKSFHIKDVLDINMITGVPICFDIHHHNCNRFEQVELQEIINKVVKTWNEFRIPKMHISSGKRTKTDPSHHDFIFIDDFEALMSLLKDHHVDVMFEAKKKELAVLRIREHVKQKNEN